jgi:hypothetical protein
MDHEILSRAVRERAGNAGERNDVDSGRAQRALLVGQAEGLGRVVKAAVRLLLFRD